MNTTKGHGSQTRTEWRVTIRTSLGTLRTEWRLTKEAAEALGRKYDVVTIEQAEHVLDY